MRAHGKLLGILLVIGGILVLVNMGLFAFFRNDDILPILKNGLTGVNIERAFRDIPVYPQAKLSTATAKQLRFSYIYQYVLESSDSAPQIAKWYSSALSGRGWVLQIPPADINAQTQSLIYEKKWNRQLVLFLSANAAGANTKITIDLGPKYQDEDLLIN